jgi:hypothetical protein
MSVIEWPSKASMSVTFLDAGILLGKSRDGQHWDYTLHMICGNNGQYRFL